MNTVALEINGQKIRVKRGVTILSAADELNIFIPTLCHAKGFTPSTSCMICVVHELNTDRLLPACSAPVEAGMRIDTDSSRVTDARKSILEFLLSQHIGNCDAPCQMACPVGMKIPDIIHCIREKKEAEAVGIMMQDMPLPAVASRLCHAPCEKACYRRQYDESISIPLLIRSITDEDPAPHVPVIRKIKAKRGQKVAIVGAGPTGLAAAYHLLCNGHDCVIYDKRDQAGGMLRQEELRERLPPSILDADIDRIRNLGAEMRMNQALGNNFSLPELKKTYAAVVLTIGALEAPQMEAIGIQTSAQGVVINRQTMETSIRGIYAGGSVVSPLQQVTRAMGQGKTIAVSIDQQLSGLHVTGPHRPFRSIMGTLQPGEAREFLKSAAVIARTQPKTAGGFTTDEARTESLRCFQCQCLKAETCRLREYSDLYHADPGHFKTMKRQVMTRDIRHHRIVHEPGKCIRCGLCVKITSVRKENLGLAFNHRGFDLTVIPPFNDSPDLALTATAAECVHHCPTGALSWKAGEGENND